jgi:hypothetical protein
LNDIASASRAAEITANILPPTLNTRSPPHWIDSAAPGKLRQSLRIAAGFTAHP